MSKCLIRLEQIGNFIFYRTPLWELCIQSELAGQLSRDEQAAVVFHADGVVIPGRNVRHIRPASNLTLTVFVSSGRNYRSIAL